MPPYDHERQGLGRREDDGHCAKHEQNTSDIAAMKASMKLMMWIIPLAVALASGITGYTVKTMNDSMITMSVSIDKIGDNVQQIARLVERNDAKLEYLEKGAGK